MNVFEGWADFYLITGGAAGALIGLQFVVVTLIAEAPAIRDQARANAAFVTPTIIHFVAVLLLSAFACVPWKGISTAAVAWGGLAGVGIVYQFVVFRRLADQEAYKPVFEDWLFHVGLPSAAYMVLLVGAIAASRHSLASINAMAASCLLLLFIGIHNAWDTVTYHVFVARPK